MEDDQSFRGYIVHLYVHVHVHVHVGHLKRSFLDMESQMKSEATMVHMNMPEQQNLPNLQRTGDSNNQVRVVPV